MEDYTKSSWTNDSWAIEWANEDEILISGPHNQECVICGGDFESVLSGLCAAYQGGKTAQ